MNPRYTIIVLAAAAVLSVTACRNRTAERQGGKMITQISNDLVCRPALDTIVRLGEGAVWDYKYNRLLWIDTQGSVMIYTPDDGKNREIELGEPVGTVVPYKKDKIIVAIRSGVYELDLNDESRTFICDPEGGVPGNKYNDGKCDARGRLWVGTMYDTSSPGNSGFYVVDGNGNGKKMLGDVTISNGVAWSLDGKTMYYQDTPTGKVSAFDFDEEKGEISNRREIITIPDGMGNPDGNTIDEEGMLWVANWEGGCVTRWNPDTGEMLCRIDVPAPNVSSVAFGGKDLDELYITTASIYMPPGVAPNYPEAGKLFVVKPGVKGIKAKYYRSEQENNSINEKSMTNEQLKGFISLALEDMKAKAEEMGIQGVATASVLNKGETVDWIGEMKVVGTPYKMKEGWNLVAIAWSKCGEVIATQADSGDENHEKIMGELGFVGGAYDEYEGCKMAFAFSGATSEEDLEVAKYGIEKMKGYISQEKGILSKDQFIQVAIVVDDIKKAAEAWATLLGVPQPEIWMNHMRSNPGYPYTYRGKDVPCDVLMCVFDMGGWALELHQIDNTPSTFREFQDKHAFGVHHLGFEVGDARDKVIQFLKDMGYDTDRTVGIYPGSSWTIVDTEDALGVNLNIKPVR